MKKSTAFQTHFGFINIGSNCYVSVLQPFTYDITHEVHFRFHLLSQKILAIKWPKGQIWKGLKKCMFVHKVIDGILAAFHYRGGHTNVQV